MCGSDLLLISAVTIYHYPLVVSAHITGYNTNYPKAPGARECGHYRNFTYQMPKAENHYAELFVELFGLSQCPVKEAFDTLDITMLVPNSGSKGKPLLA